jgi:hypothetical protein
LVDTADLNSAAARKGAYRFDPGSRHQARAARGPRFFPDSPVE